MRKSSLNPNSLFPSRPYGFSHGVLAEGGRTLYLSGQVAWDENQNITLRR